MKQQKIKACLPKKALLQLLSTLSIIRYIETFPERAAKTALHHRGKKVRKEYYD